jgi:hypothetical protein
VGFEIVMTEPTPAKRKVGLKIFQCPWYGGDTREGEALVNLTTLAGQVPPVFGPMTRMGIQRFGLLSSETPSREKMLWCEKTGSKTGCSKGATKRRSRKSMDADARYVVT